MTVTETYAAPDKTEMAARLSRLRDLMRAEGIDTYVLTDPNNILWLTNFANYVHERPFVMVVPLQGRPAFLVPRLELDHVEARVVPATDFVTYREFPAPKGERYSDRLRELLPSNAERIAVEPTIPLMIAEIIGSKRVRCELIEEARAIKSDYEVARIAYACRLISDAHAELLRAARIGLSQSEINATIGKAIFARMAGDDPNVNPFATKIFTVIQDAAASHDPHNFSNLDMAMREGGPHVSVFNAVLNGYGAEIERTFFLGHVPEAARAPFDVMLEAREKVFELTRPGATMSDVDEAATDVFRKYGYEKNIRHRAGHGMGVTAHEGPFLAAGEMKVISPGMVFTIEPGIYFPGLGGFRYSDTVLTTETGLVCLTKGPTSLEELTL